MSELVEQAAAWMRDAHPHFRHLDRTLAWLLELEPGAGEALRIAAVTHDAERAFPAPSPPWDSAGDFDALGYLRYHQGRCAGFVHGWLREQGAPERLVRDAVALVTVHEEGGWPDADLLQAADSLSFLEVMTGLVLGWIADRRVPPERAAAKVRWMRDRIAVTLPRARELAVPLTDAALERIREAV